jgi:hypothetical protein
MVEEIEREDWEGSARVVGFIDPDLANLFTRVAEFVRREELSTRLDVPECSMSVNEDGEFIFTLYLSQRVLREE